MPRTIRKIAETLDLFTIFAREFGRFRQLYEMRDKMRVVLLAGGLGTRMREETEFRPKPMVLVGGNPVLWHIMKIYSHFNIQDFVVCAGYKGEMIKEYFLNYEALQNDFTIKLGGGVSRLKYEGSHSESDWEVTVSDTGQDTNTGGRLKKIQKYVKDETFMCTYGDGIADVDIEGLLAFHRSHGKIATMTITHPPSRFGVVDVNDAGLVNKFFEKPNLSSWINIGYFVFEPGIFDYLTEQSILEQDPLATLAEENQLAAFEHTGFWQPMDTFREAQILNDIWSKEDAPWKKYL